MKLRLSVFLLALALSSALAWGDQIVLKDGREYSGQFVRGDASVVEFRILSRVESFKTSEVSQIVFKEPQLVTAPAGRTTAPEAEATPSSVRPRLLSSDRDSRPSAAREPSPQIAGAAVTLPTGTGLTIRTTTIIDTDRNRVGDVFEATLEEPLSVGGQVVAPRGTEVRGKIAYAKEAGKVSGRSELILELAELKLNGKTYPLRTSDYSEVGSSKGKRTAATAGGGAALGAIIGAIAGGGKGAAIGAGAGATVGTGVQVLRGETLKVPAETVLEFRLQSPLTVDVPGAR